jgi:hypothetical protein
MNFFKKALIATAVAGTFGAVQAADLTDAVTAHSIQGLEVNGAATSSIRAIVREQLEAGDLITLEFGDGVDLSAAAVDVTGTGGAVASTVYIVYGSGTYTFSQHSSTDLANNVLVLEVNTGDPVTLDSSFEVQVDAALFDASKAAQTTVTYSAVSGLTGNPKDTTGDNVGLLLTTQDQYAINVKAQFDGIVERVNQVTFQSKGDLLANASNDASVDDSVLFDVTDNQTLLSAVAATTSNVVVKLGASVKEYAADILAAEGFLLASDKTLITAGANASVAKTSDSLATVTVGADATSVSATTELEDFYLVLKAPVAAGKTLPITDFDADVEFNFGGAAAYKVSGLNAGEWKLDATVINVPYFPVGYAGTSTSIHLANETGSEVDVIVSAIDDSGTVYPAVNLGAKLAAETVTKVGQSAIMSLFSITDPTKLSVTFNIDADDGDVNGYAFTSSEAGRAQLANSQQKGK